MRARYKGKCERCLGQIRPGEDIRPCTGVYGAWEHTDDDVCDQARRERWLRWVDEMVREGLIDPEEGEQILAVQQAL